jgi:hypothetical protein
MARKNSGRGFSCSRPAPNFIRADAVAPVSALRAVRAGASCSSVAAARKRHFPRVAVGELFELAEDLGLDLGRVLIKSRLVTAT